MEFIGQIIKVCEPRTGVSERTGNEWKTQGFVFEYKEHDTDPWHDRVYLETFDENIMMNLVEGAIAKVGFRHATREYNGRVFNDVRMNNFELVGKPMTGSQGAQQPAQPANGGQATNNQQPQQNAPQGSGNAGGGEADDLPF